MKQMKEMYMSLQEICQELKRMGSHREDASGVSSRHQSVSEAVDSRVDRAPVLGQSRRHETLNYASYLRENGPHQPNRRAKSVPKSRVNRDSGFTKGNSVYVQDRMAHLGIPPMQHFLKKQFKWKGFTVENLSQPLSNTMRIASRQMILNSGRPAIHCEIWLSGYYLMLILQKIGILDMASKLG